MPSRFTLLLFLLLSAGGRIFSQNSLPESFDAVPSGLPLPEGQGLMWESPRELHNVVVDFGETIPANLKPRLEYWGSHWPQQRLPKDHALGGGDVGWMELGNWY